ncbi:hypothetical protein [Methylobacter sp.]|uniref:hypothetical protein n=1 Tax=Methylobacter sp. TaxID=2051955 RepID=UPI003DA3C9FE
MPAPLQKFLIAPLKSGQQNNVKPWLIANDAYESLRNAYTWRGRVKKRVGARVMDQSKPLPLQQQFTRLRLQVDTTDLFGNAAGVVPGTVFAVGQMFSIGDDYFTVNVAGNPAPLLSTNPAAAGTYDTTTGAYTFLNANPLTPVYFYPATPVMALQLYNRSNINDERTIAFDTQFSYEYLVPNGWQRSGVGTQGLWSGSDSQFHWTTNYRGATSSDYILFVVNNNAPDGIQYFDGTNWFTLAAPILNAAGDTLLTSLMVVPFKDRLLFLNVTENVVGPGQTTFTSRIIFSQNGSPFQVDAFRQDIVGKGGYIEAPTKESIISCEFLKDRLIIFFENSTWELVYNNNQVLPFSFQKINTELGVESTHSIIPFDKVTIGMGSTGLHACSGVNVQRIDDLIPYTVFEIQNINAGPQRVYGIRDYFEELCYWTYSSTQASYRGDNTFPNRVLVYDYTNSTWAFNDDSITALGYFYLQDDLLVWQNITSTWEEMTQQWDDFESDQLFRSVIAGNQEGWTFIIQPDLERNCMALQITDIVPGVNNVTLTIVNHNILPDSWIFISNIQFVIGSNLTVLNGMIRQAIYVDPDTIMIIIPGLFGVYAGGGTVERVSQIKILTKQYNLFPEAGMATFFPYIDFLVSRTRAGAITVDYYIETSQQSMITDGTNAGSILGTNILQTSPYVLRPFEQIQDEFWHRVNFGTYGDFVQLNLYFSDTQMVDPNIVFSEFTLNAFLIYAKPENNYF